MVMPSLERIASAQRAYFHSDRRPLKPGETKYEIPFTFRLFIFFRYIFTVRVISRAPCAVPRAMICVRCGRAHAGPLGTKVSCFIVSTKNTNPFIEPTQTHTAPHTPTRSIGWCCAIPAFIVSSPKIITNFLVTNCLLSSYKISLVHYLFAIQSRHDAVCSPLCPCATCVIARILYLKICLRWRLLRKAKRQNALR